MPLPKLGNIVERHFTRLNRVIEPNRVGPRILLIRADLLVRAGSYDAAEADALRGFLKKRLAGFKVPKYIWFMNESLPRNASGKFLKRELRDSLDPAEAV